MQKNELKSTKVLNQLQLFSKQTETTDRLMVMGNKIVAKCIACFQSPATQNSI